MNFNPAKNIRDYFALRTGLRYLPSMHEEAMLAAERLEYLLGEMPMRSPAGPAYSMLEIHARSLHAIKSTIELHAELTVQAEETGRQL